MPVSVPDNKHSNTQWAVDAHAHPTLLGTTNPSLRPFIMQWNVQSSLIRRRLSLCLISSYVLSFSLVCALFSLLFSFVSVCFSFSSSPSFPLSLPIPFFFSSSFFSSSSLSTPPPPPSSSNSCFQPRNQKFIYHIH